MPSHLIYLLIIATMTTACRAAGHPHDHAMDSAIKFEEFGLSFDLPDKNTRFRFDGVVDDLDDHQMKILAEFGLENSRMICTNPASKARTLSWRGDDGVTWVISFGLAHPDERITRARLTHEKYHALNRASPKSIPLLYAALEARELRVNWNEYNEELRATIVEVASLLAQGIQIESLSGSELIVTAVDILRAGMKVREAETLVDSGPPSAPRTKKTKPSNR